MKIKVYNQVQSSGLELSVSAKKPVASDLTKETTLGTLIPVQLPKEDLEKFIKAFHPKRAAKAPAAFAEEALFLTEVSAYITSIFIGLRYGMSRLQYTEPTVVSALQSQLGDIITREIDITYKARAALDKRAKEYMLAMSSGRHHIIKDSVRYQGGKDILYVGLRGPNVSPLIDSGHQQSSLLPILSSSYVYNDQKDKYESAIGKALIETGLEIQALFFGKEQASAITSSYKRIQKQHQIGPKWNLIEQVTKIFMSGPLAKLGIAVMLPAFTGKQTDHSVARLYEYVSVLALREPNHTIVTQRVRTKDTPDESLGICMEAQALQPDVRFSFVINLPKNFCEYITQTKDEQIPLVPLNTWAITWGGAMLKWANTRSSSDQLEKQQQGGKSNTPWNAPHYILRPSVSDDLIKRRKELGLYSEKGRVNEDGLFITYNGDLAFLNTSEDSATKNAKEYEAISEEALAISFEAGTPLAAGQRGSTGPVFELASPKYAEKISQLKDSLNQYKGSVQAINWDLNTIVTVSVASPDHVVATKLLGASKPEALNLAVYLRSAFNAGMNNMFSRTKVTVNDRKVMASKDAFSDVSNAIGSSSVFLNFATVYNHFIKLGKVPTVGDLVKKAAEALKVASLEDETISDFELMSVDRTRTIYGNLLNRDLTLASDGSGGRTIIALLAAAARQASAVSGTQFARICIRDNLEFTEHDRYYNGKTSTVGEFNRLYTWFGGQVFYQAVKAMLAVDRKDLLSPGTATAEQSDGHPGFLSIISEVMPMCVLFGKYTTPQIRDKIFEDADSVKEAESSFTESDLNIAGSKPKVLDPKGNVVEKGMKLFPHQAEALVRLKPHPKVAILDIAPGGGKCLDPDSLVPTKSGMLTLGELWEEATPVVGRTDIRILGRKVSTINGNKSTDGVYSSHGKTHRVVLKDGTEFIGLPEHRLYALDSRGRLDFVRLDQMIAHETYMPKAVGTRIFAAKPPKFASFNLSDFHVNTQNAHRRTVLPTHLSVDFAQLLGLLVAEGYTPDGDTVAFCNHDQEVLAFYDQVLLSEFNLPIPERARVGRRLHDQFTGAFFSSILTRGLSADKQIPKVVRQAPEQHQCAFLRGLFEGDGTISNGVRARISYTTLSQQLANQVKALLENIGIYCSIKAKFKTATNGTSGNQCLAYNVSIWQHSDNVRLFAEKIGFMSDRKNARLQARLLHIAKLDLGQNTNQFAHGQYNKVPCLTAFNSLLSRVEHLLSQATYTVAFGTQSRTCKFSLQKVLADNGLRFKAIRPKSSVVTRYNIETLLSVLANLGSELSYVGRDSVVASLVADIKHLSSFVWAPVVFTEKCDKRQVFDLSVPDNHTYVVNGYLGHNTTIGISDIAMLYADGLIKKPFVFAPNRLVRNWIEDCHKSLKGWNVIPVTTETYAEWGEERLTEMIKSAPPNTIVVIGNSFISSTPKTQLVIGNSVDTMSNAVEFCKKFEPDYVIIDESHRIRNIRSELHKGIKSINQMSSVKYGRIATGTLIQNVLSDVVGQSSIYSGQIFRTTDEFEDAHKGVVAIVNDKPIVDYLEDTPLKARRRLAEFATVISFKRKEWAFMLPMPIETFYTVDMDKEGETGHKLQQFYNAVLQKTLDEAKNDPRLKKNKGKKEDDEGDDADEDDRKVSTANGVNIDVSDTDDDSDNTDELEAALQPYLQRLERILTDPFGDPDLIDVAKEIFGDDFDEHYTTPKVAKVIDCIKKHFTQVPWEKGKTYKGSDMVDYNGKSYIFKSELAKGDGEDVSHNAPDSDPDNWKPQVRGKVFIVCRYTRSVDAIFKALPKEYQQQAVRFHGDVDGKDDNLARFQNDDKCQILIANEMGVTEGHNFQMASRFIRVEAPWAPGELDQTASRIFRPDVGGEYMRQTIFLDWILCDNTLEVAKMGRLISKMLKRAKFDELDNPKYYKDLNPLNHPVIKMSLDNIRALNKIDDLCAVAGLGSVGDIHEHSYIGQYQYLIGQMGAEFREMRATKRAYMLDVEPTPMPKGSEKLAFTPWVPNLHVEDEANDGLVPLREALEDENSELAALFKKDRTALLGQYVRTEFGLGVITRVTTKKATSSDDATADAGGNEISKVAVKLSQGGGVEMLSASKVYLATNITERNKNKYNDKAPKITTADKKRTEAGKLKAEKALARIRAKEEVAKKQLAKIKVAPKAIEPEPEAEEAKEIYLYPMVYNGFLALEGSADLEYARELKRYGFEKAHDYAAIKVANYRNFTALLTYLENKYTLLPKVVKYLDMLHESFQSGKGRKFQVELAPYSDFPIFHRTQARPTMVKNKRKPELHLYPMLRDGVLFLVVDLVNNLVFKRELKKAIPNVSGATFQEFDGMFMHFFKNKPDLIKKVAEIRTVGKFKVVNIAELKEEVRALSLKSALSNK